MAYSGSGSGAGSGPWRAIGNPLNYAELQRIEEWAVWSLKTVVYSYTDWRVPFDVFMDALEDQQLRQEMIDEIVVFLETSRWASMVSIGGQRYLQGINRG